jgi:prepilin-type N-terminal cleavage/methylation domain-containing protein
MKNKNEAGFSVLEMMVAVAIMSILVSFTVQAFLSGSRIVHANLVSSNIASEIRRGMESMTQELRNSSLARITVIQPGVLQFQTPTNMTQDGVITWSGILQYSLGGINQQLLRTDLATGQTRVYANYVTALTFTVTQNPATIAIVMTAQQQTPDRITYSETLRSAVELRN